MATALTRMIATPRPQLTTSLFGHDSDGEVESSDEEDEESDEGGSPGEEEESDEDDNS